MEAMKILLYLLIFPGFLFTAVCGMLASFIDRKLTARVQWRRGPPLLQPLYDFIKLLGKETIVPKSANKLTFLLAPIIGFAVVILVSTILGLTLINPETSFAGDLIVVIYLLTIPSLCIIIGGFSSGNPIASLGASREMRLILGYELPFVLSILVPVIKSGSIKLGEIVTSTYAISSISGIIALVVSIICMQAKLGLIPFDAPEAEQEIIAGSFIEYSGTPLAIFKLTKWMLLFVLPVFLITVFMPTKNVISFIIKYLILLVVVILIKNTNPRLRVDQIIKFSWIYLTVLSFIAVIFALKGL
jgi:NADH-quinone oxidoreductase subunit H